MLFWLFDLESESEQKLRQKPIQWICLTKSKRSTCIFNVKNTITLAQLCEGLPSEFLLYMKYCRLLRFHQKPDYDLLRNLFIVLFKNNQYTLDYIYDWNIVAKQKKTKMIKTNTN